MTHTATPPDHEKKPVRIGVIIAPGFDKELAALQFLILQQNTTQQSIEYQLLPTPADWELEVLLSSKEELDRRKVEEAIHRARGPYFDWLKREATAYEADLEPVEGVAIVSNVIFSDNYYVTWESDWALLALGNWKRFMAPPSALEFIQTFLVIAAVDIASGENWPRRHLATKGCIFDLNAGISDARLGVLTGFICHKCQTQITSANTPIFLQDVATLAQSKSLGDVTKPSERALLVKKLGFDLFRTKGIRPSAWEKVRSTLEEEAVKTLLKIAGAILIAVLLLVFGLM